MRFWMRVVNTAAILPGRSAEVVCPALNDADRLASAKSSYRLAGQSHGESPDWPAAISHGWMCLAGGFAQIPPRRPTPKP